MEALSEVIERTAERLRRAAPEATIILFGSQARGDACADSGSSR